MNKDVNFFDEVAKDWDSMVNHDPKKVNRLMELLPLKPNDRVLDVGSGTGVLVPFLLERLPNGELIEMDISQNMLNVAASKYKDKRISFVCGDASVENEKLGTFDAIVAYSMFPHFEDKQAAIKALVKKLKSGGVIGILHSQSRDALNHMHSHAEEKSVHEAILPQMDVIKGWLEGTGCKMIEWLDDDEFFAAVAKKL